MKPILLLPFALVLLLFLDAAARVALYNFGRRFIYFYIVFVKSAVVIVIIIIPTICRAENQARILVH